MEQLHITLENLEDKIDKMKILLRKLHQTADKQSENKKNNFP